MSHTGWGQRSLTSGELGACFDLSDFVEWHPRFLAAVAPLQLIRSVINCVTETDYQRPIKCQKTIMATTSSSVVDGVWLASINAWIPGSSWASGVISDKAVKSDDARIDTQP